MSPLNCLLEINVCFLANTYWNLDVFNNESIIANFVQYLTGFNSVLTLLVFLLHFVFLYALQIKCIFDRHFAIVKL